MCWKTRLMSGVSTVREIAEAAKVKPNTFVQDGTTGGL